MKNKKGVLSLISGIIILLVLGLIYGWSIFRSPLNTIFPDWSAANLSLNFTISIIFFCVGGFLSSKITGKKGPRFTLRLGAILLLAGFLGVSFLNPNAPTQSLIMLYIFYGFLSGTGVGLGYNSLLSTVTKHFPGKTGSVSGLLLLGFGTGSLLLGSIASSLIADYGVFTTFKILAVIALVVVMVFSFFITSPENIAAASGKSESDFSPSKMLKRPSFWIFTIWNIALSAGGLLVINSSALIVKSFGAAATIGLMVSVFNGIGRPLIGIIFDKAGRKAGMLAPSGFLIIAAVLMAAAWKTGNIFLLFPGLALTGIAYGGAPTGTSFVIGKFFGQTHYATNLSVATFALIPAAISGPYVSGVLQDASGGDFFTTFVMMGIFGILALAMSLLLRKA